MKEILGLILSAFCCVGGFFTCRSVAGSRPRASARLGRRGRAAAAQWCNGWLAPRPRKKGRSVASPCPLPLLGRLGRCRLSSRTRRARRSRRPACAGAGLAAAQPPSPLHQARSAAASAPSRSASAISETAARVVRSAWQLLGGGACRGRVAGGRGRPGGRAAAGGRRPRVAGCVMCVCCRVLRGIAFAAAALRCYAFHQSSSSSSSSRVIAPSPSLKQTAALSSCQLQL
jgi:hypothetical protein